MTHLRSILPRLIRGLLPLLLFVGLSAPLPAAVELPNGRYHHTVEDLMVKIPGGRAVIARTWYEGEWHINRTLNDLIFSYDSLSGEIQSIERNGDDYTRSLGAEPPVYAFGKRHYITTIETGYRWNNRQGDWIDYDADGRMQAYGNTNGTTVQVERDPQGRIVSVQDHQGNPVLHYRYDPDGRLIEIHDNSAPEPRRVGYSYQGEQLSRVTDVLGEDWQYAYDAQGRLVRHTDPLGRSRHIAYDPTDRAASDTDDDGIGISYRYDYDRTKKEYHLQRQLPEGRVIDTWYDADGLELRRDVNGKTERQLVKDGERRRLITDRRGHTTVRDYDEWENLTKLTHPDGATETTTYDYRFHRPIEKTDANGQLTRYQYDDQGNLTRLTQAAGSPVERVVESRYDEYGQLLEHKIVGDAATAESSTRYAYDANGNLVSRTDPEGGITRYSHDIQGQILTRTDPNQNTWRYDHDPAGRLTATTDPEGNRTSHQYDAVGNRTQTTDARNQATSYRYDARNNRIRSTDSTQHITQLAYDSADRLNAISDPLGNTRRLAYNAEGRLISQTDPAGNTTTQDYGEGQGGQYPGLLNATQYPTYRQSYDYDRRGRRIRVTDQLGEARVHATETAYDAVGNRIQTTDAEGRVTRYRYDARDRLVEILDPLGQSTTFGYDDRDNLLSVTDPNGHTTRYQYDTNDRKTRETRPGGQTHTYGYDSAGNLIASTDPDGRRTENSYDKAGRLIAQRHYAPNQAEPERTVAYTYDPNGNLTGWGDGRLNATYQYDENNRKTQETTDYGPFSLTHRYSYDANGNPTSYTGPDGITVSYYWDQDRLSRIQLPDQGSITVNAYHWNRIERLTLPGGTTRHYAYDPLMRPTRIRVEDPATHPVMDYAYDYDRTGNITRKDTEQGAHDYRYDDLQRLIEAASPTETEGWSYDPNGNRTEDQFNPGPWAYDANDRLLASPSTQYQYDQAGNTVRKTEGPNTLQYGYNAENRLSRIEDQTGSLIAEYEYDPLGRRIKKTTPNQTLYYHYTDQGLAGEYSETGAPIRQYGYAPDSTWTTDPIYQKTEQGYVFYQNDHLGTPQRLTTPNGATVWQANYRAFGEVTQETGTWENPLRFPGQYHDQETGLHYNYFRDYDPTVGRYIQADHIGQMGGINLYQFARLNSLRFIDLFGLEPLRPYNENNWKDCTSVVIRRGTKVEPISYTLAEKLLPFRVGYTFTNYSVSISIGLDKRKRPGVSVDADHHWVYIYHMKEYKGTSHVPYKRMKFFCKKELPCGKNINWPSGPHDFLDGEPWKEVDVVDDWYESGREYRGTGPIPHPY